MKKIKHTLIFAIAFCTLTLAFSSCHKEKITKWKYVGYEGCNIELTIDNEADLVYVSADYSDFIPDPMWDKDFLFIDKSIYQKVGDTLLRLNSNNEITYYGFSIVSQSDESMDLTAFHSKYPDRLLFYITDYHFVRIN